MKSNKKNPKAAAKPLREKKSSPDVETVLYHDHLAVVLDEKIRATVRAAVAWLDLGSALRRQCNFGGALCEEITGCLGSMSGVKEVDLERQTRQLQDFEASHASYVKHRRILINRIEDVLLFVDKIRSDVNEVDSARAFKASLLAMKDDGADFRNACNLVLKDIERRDPHLMSLVRCYALKLDPSGQDNSSDLSCVDFDS